jgi:hypothetical protein
MKAKKGNVAEINLLLTAMLLHEGIQTNPVLISTRSNGLVYSLYPFLHQYNYTITQAKIGDEYFFLDASEPMIGFNRLPLRCYNEEGRAINQTANIVTLSADSVKEVKRTNVNIISDEKGKMIGSMKQTPGYYESLHLREQVKEKGIVALQKETEKDFGADVIISKFGIDSLRKYEYELGIHYDFDLKEEMEDILYFKPMLGEAYKENLFKAAKRFYPVEMPYTIDEIYILQLEVPRGYVVDELPKSMLLKLNEENEGFFEYRVSHSGNIISLRSRIKIGRAYFLPDEYPILREFFSLVVNKQTEQIVLKRKTEL